MCIRDRKYCWPLWHSRQNGRHRTVKVGHEVRRVGRVNEHIATWRTAVDARIPTWSRRDKQTNVRRRLLRDRSVTLSSAFARTHGSRNGSHRFVTRRPSYTTSFLRLLLLLLLPSHQDLPLNGRRDVRLSRQFISPPTRSSGRRYYVLLQKFLSFSFLFQSLF